MRAAFLSKEGFVIKEIPEPKLHDVGIVLKVEACGICGSDIRIWRKREELSEPVIRGHEITGTVVETKGEVPYQIGMRLALGADVNCLNCSYCRRGHYNLCVNKKILGNDLPGGFVQYMVLDKYLLEHGIINELPENVDFVEGTIAEPLSSIIAMQRRLNIGVGDVVVVFGAGPMGCLIANLSLMLGTRVILVDLIESRLKKARDILGDSVIYANSSENNVEALVKDVTNNIGADFAIVAAPSSQAQQLAVYVVRKRGTVVLFGGLPQTEPFTSLDANRIHYYEINVVGSFSYNPWDHKMALEFLSQKKIDARKYVKEFPLDMIEDVFEEISEGKNIEYLKAVINPWR